MKFFFALSMSLMFSVCLSAHNNPFDDDDDQLTIGVLHQTLMNASKQSQLLDVEFNVTVANENLIAFSMKTKEAMNFKLTLCDLDGNKVAERDFLVSTGDNYRTLNISNVLEGNYMISLINGDKKALKLIGIIAE